jgi:predicted GIY-YIG superfamily endonuclease
MGICQLLYDIVGDIENRSDSHQEGQTGKVTESYVHVQLHRPTRFQSNVKRGKMSVVHASM